MIKLILTKNDFKNFIINKLNMEHMIENYYNSPNFQEQRTVLEKQGKTKEECLKIIKSNLIDKTKLNENLDTITKHNVKHYFKELSIKGKMTIRWIWSKRNK